jgi:hypothetical protein
MFLSIPFITLGAMGRNLPQSITMILKVLPLTFGNGKSPPDIIAATSTMFLLEYTDRTRKRLLMHFVLISAGQENVSALSMVFMSVAPQLFNILPAACSSP